MTCSWFLGLPDSSSGLITHNIKRRALRIHISGYLGVLHPKLSSKIKKRCHGNMRDGETSRS
jgi:hypothetical protein